jgi:hypothetical protein
MEKQCNKCGELKSINEFYKRKENKDGHHGVCKLCYDSRIKKYNINNREKRLESCTKYNNNNKDKQKQYYLVNKDKIKERNELNRVERLNYSKQYYTNNKEKILHKIKEYRKNNRDKIKQYNQNNKVKRNNWYNTKRENNSIFKLKTNLKVLIRNSIKRNGYSKKSRTHEILGCSFEEFKLHLESKFEPWMNWDNYGLYNGELNYGWDIDHVIPTSSATSEQEIIKLNHFTNLQPLCSKVNRDIKRNKVG